MKTLKVKNTYDINIKGKPSTTVLKLSDVTKVAVNPSRITGIKPKLLVKEGDSVQIGTPLFLDKKDPRIQFVSPASGLVSGVTYGPKRRLDEVIITVDASETAVSFGVQTDGFTRETVTEKLLAAGLWGTLTAYPFQQIPSPDQIPPSLYVSLDYDEPYLPQAEVYFSQYAEELRLGLKALKALSDTVVVSVSAKNPAIDKVSDIVTHVVDGNYPATDPGVVLYYNKKDATENKAWGIRALDVIRIGQLFKTGQYPTERLLVVAGPLASQPQHVLAREGVSVADLLKTQAQVTEPLRCVAGGVLTGTKVEPIAYLGYQDFALHMIREGKAPEMLTFFRPGFDKPTYSKTYLSALLNKEAWDMNTSLNGGERACISCSACPEVCPVEILPQFVMKSLYAKDYEEAIKLGFLDCVGCGLCTYVCPSKINLNDVFDEARERLAKEV